jgi:SAM-dependent methyltransferase
VATRFDKAYFDRYYRNPSTRVGSRRDTLRLARFVCSYLKFLDQPVARVVDLGCGLGWWRDAIGRHFPRAIYTGVEVSPYLCREHGWQRGSVADWQASEPFDLVICQGVLQYLDAAGARAAFRNLARLCGGALYLEALTREDWERNCDRETTDGDTWLRPAAWYRAELEDRFTNCGGGVFLAPGSPAVLFELEKPG